MWFFAPTNPTAPLLVYLRYTVKAETALVTVGGEAQLSKTAYVLAADTAAVSASSDGAVVHVARHPPMPAATLSGAASTWAASVRADYRLPSEAQLYLQQVGLLRLDFPPGRLYPQAEVGRHEVGTFEVVSDFTLRSYALIAGADSIAAQGHDSQFHRNYPLPAELGQGGVGLGTVAPSIRVARSLGTASRSYTWQTQPAAVALVRTAGRLALTVSGQATLVRHARLGASSQGVASQLQAAQFYYGKALLAQTRGMAVSAQSVGWVFQRVLAATPLSATAASPAQGAGLYFHRRLLGETQTNAWAHPTTTQLLFGYGLRAQARAIGVQAEASLRRTAILLAQTGSQTANGSTAGVTAQRRLAGAVRVHGLAVAAVGLRSTRRLPAAVRVVSWGRLPALTLRSRYLAGSMRLWQATYRSAQVYRHARMPGAAELLNAELKTAVLSWNARLIALTASAPAKTFHSVPKFTNLGLSRDLIARISENRAVVRPVELRDNQRMAEVRQVNRFKESVNAVR